MTRGVARSTRLLAAAAAVLVAAGCGAGAPRRATTTTAAPARPSAARKAEARQALTDALSGIHRPALRIPAGYRIHAFREAGVSLALPFGWHALEGRDARYPGVVQTLTHVNPMFGPYLMELGAPDSTLKLFAFASPSAGRDTAIATVQTITSRKPGAYARWSRAVLRTLGKLKNVRGNLASRRVELSAGTALRVEYRRTDGAGILIYVVAQPQGLWAVTFTGPHATRAERRSYDAAARTIVLTPSSGGPQVAGGATAPSS